MKKIQTWAYFTVILYVFFITFWLVDANKKIADLSAENVKFRVIKSTIDKLTYRTSPNVGADARFIIQGADVFTVDPDFLFVIRRAENGRYLFEMGAQNISKRIKDLFPNDPDGWNFYESAYLISRQQMAFSMKNYPEFVEFLGKTYPNSDPKVRRRWVKTVDKMYADMKNPSKSTHR